MGDYNRWYCCQCGTSYTANLAAKCLECEFPKPEPPPLASFTSPVLPAAASDTWTTLSSSLTGSDDRNGSSFGDPCSKSEHERLQMTNDDSSPRSSPSRLPPATLQPGDRIPTAADFHRYQDSDPPRYAQQFRSHSIPDRQTADSR